MAHRQVISNHMKKLLTCIFLLLVSHHWVAPWTVVNSYEHISQISLLSQMWRENVDLSHLKCFPQVIEFAVGWRSVKNKEDCAKNEYWNGDGFCCDKCAPGTVSGHRHLMSDKTLNYKNASGYCSLVKIVLSHFFLCLRV